MGLFKMSLPFISLTARVASSGALKHTKPKPRLRSPSFISFITRALVMVPITANSSRRISSVTFSSKFFTYKLVPWNLCMRSIFWASNLALSSRSRSDFFCARLTKSSTSISSPSMVLVENFLPFKFSKAAAASSWLTKLTKPKPRVTSFFSISVSSLCCFSPASSCSSSSFFSPSSSAFSFSSASTGSSFSSSSLALSSSFSLSCSSSSLAIFVIRLSLLLIVALATSPNASNSTLSLASSHSLGMFFT
mmetsp:Transcript_22065/g.33100  ORF Transcript_22065/g.33100 Transcript_22065/m.33100 type:complete len:250 (-) Transcript_22065:828-1577(-)